MRILLVEDDTILGAAVRDHIAADNHSVDWVTRLDAAIDHLDSTAYDLVLLDLMLPDGQGIAFLRDLRRKGSVTPVVILTALDQISDRINGLNAGADDYMTKPFDLSELSARLSAVARRYSGNPNPLVEVGGLQIDLAARTVLRSGRPVDLTAREWSLLEALVQHPGHVISKAQLEERLYAFGSEVESNHVSRLRKKLGCAVVETVRGLGYRLGACDDAPRSLQWRLSLWLGLGLTLLWVATAAVTTQKLRHEMDEVFDSALEEVGQRLLPLAVRDIIGRDSDDTAERGDDARS